MLELIFPLQGFEEHKELKVVQHHGYCSVPSSYREYSELCNATKDLVSRTDCTVRHSSLCLVKVEACLIE